MGWFDGSCVVGLALICLVGATVTTSPGRNRDTWHSEIGVQALFHISNAFSFSSNKASSHTSTLQYIAKPGSIEHWNIPC